MQLPKIWGKRRLFSSVEKNEENTTTYLRIQSPKIGEERETTKCTNNFSFINSVRFAWMLIMGVCTEWLAAAAALA